MTNSQRDLVAGLVRAIAMDLAAPVRVASGGLHESMWNSMPANAKLRYFLGEFDPIAAGGYVGQCWDGEQWTSESPERSCEWWERDGATACSLFARFVKPYRP
jgi:hypothetical protein